MPLFLSNLLSSLQKFQSLTKRCPVLTFTEELQSIKESESKLKQQYVESQRRERILARRLAVKEQEMQDFAVSFPNAPLLRLSNLFSLSLSLLFHRVKLPSLKPPRPRGRPPSGRRCSIRPSTYSFKSSRTNSSRPRPSWRKHRTSCPRGSSPRTRTPANG